MAQAAVFFHSEIVRVQRFWCFFVLGLLLAVSGGEEIVLIRDAELLGQDRGVRELEGRSSVQKWQWPSGSHFYI